MSNKLSRHERVGTRISCPQTATQPVGYDDRTSRHHRGVRCGLGPGMHRDGQQRPTGTARCQRGEETAVGAAQRSNAPTRTWCTNWARCWSVVFPVRPFPPSITNSRPRSCLCARTLYAKGPCDRNASSRLHLRLCSILNVGFPWPSFAPGVNE